MGYWMDKVAKLQAAERQGVCSDCGQPLTRPLNPRQPDVCGRCEGAYKRLAWNKGGK
jgi:hypothetical protein